MNRVSSYPTSSTKFEAAPPATLRGTPPPVEAEDTEVGFALHLEDLFDDDEVSFDDFDLDLP